MDIKGLYRPTQQITSHHLTYKVELTTPIYHLAIEDIVRCVFVELEIPHECHSVWVMRDVGIGVVRHQQELGVLHIPT